MRVFMIGATGYIGGTVARRLLADGHEIVGLTRSEEGVEVLRGNGIEPLAGALGDLDVLRGGAVAADVTIQVATGGFLGQALATADEAMRTVETLIAAVEGTDKRYVYTSGTGLWGDTGFLDPERVVTEHDPVGPPYFYLHLVRIRDMLVAAANRGARVLVIAPGQVYGNAGGHIGPVARRFESVRQFGKVYVFEEASNAFTMVHVEDLADLYALALDAEGARGVYIGAVKTEASLDVARAVSRAVGLDGEVESLSLTELSRTLGPAMRQDFLMNVRASGEKARSELGWDPHRPDLADELASLPCPVDPSQYYPGPRGPLPARSAAI